MLLRLVSTDLAMLKGPGFLMTGKKYRLGRSSECSFVVKDGTVSRIHAELHVHDNCLLVKDLGSFNGTFVEGAKIKHTELRPGQKVLFGSARFRLVAHELSNPTADDLSDASTFALKSDPPKRNGRKNQPPRLELLTVRQRLVLRYLLSGMSEKEVASHLNIAVDTVHHHVCAIYKRLKVNSRAELLALFITDSD